MAPVSLAAIMAEIKAHSLRHYVYVLHRPCGAPFYVGVGTGRRIRHHERNAHSALQTAKYEIMREISAAGGACGYSISSWHDDWQEAAKEERRLIGEFGRADLGRGPLANRTNGGQGTSGIKWHSSEGRLSGAAKAAEKNKGRKQTAEHQAKKSAAMKGHVWSAETQERRTASLKGRTIPAEVRAKMSAAKRGREIPASVRAAQKEWVSRNKKDFSEKIRAAWTPEMRERASEIRRGKATYKRTEETNEHRRVSMREKWASRRSRPDL